MSKPSSGEGGVSPHNPREHGIGETRDLLSHPLVRFLQEQLGYTVREGNVRDLSQHVMGFRDKVFPTGDQEGTGTNRTVFGERTIQERKQQGKEHVVNFLLAPHPDSKRTDYAFGGYVDGQHVQGNHDDNIGEVNAQLRLCEAVATFGTPPGEIPTWTPEYQKWEAEWREKWKQMMERKETQ